MAIEFLKETPSDVLTKLNEELYYVDCNVDPDSLKDLSVMRLNVIKEALSGRIEATKRNNPYGSWLKESEYTRDTILHDIVETMIGIKEAKMESEKILVGESYYTKMSNEDGVLSGFKAYVTESDIHGWIPIVENENLLKIMTVLKEGDTEDFRNIYVGMANGKTDGLINLSFEHITESTPDAVSEMVEYCDQRWGSEWPWEVEAPEKLKHVIECREENKMQRLNEMYSQMTELLREFEEIHMNQFELVNAAQDMMKRVDGMITDLGKLSSSGIEVMANAKASGNGDINPLQNALGEPLNAAVEALTDLKASLTKTMRELSGEEMGDVDSDMGSPEDKMGARPEKDDLADLPITGDENERPTKDF